MSSLAESLLAFQRDAPAVQKSAINPHFRNRYVPLEELIGAVVPALAKRGLVLLQAPTTLADGTPALRTRLWHAESDESVDDVMPLALADGATPQAQGSAITYARRYALMAMLGLAADEDDDAERASVGGSSGAGARSLSSASPLTDKQVKLIMARGRAAGLKSTGLRALIVNALGADIPSESLQGLAAMLTRDRLDGLLEAIAKEAPK